MCTVGMACTREEAGGAESLAKPPDLEQQAGVLLALLEDCCALLPAWMRGQPVGGAANDDMAQVPLMLPLPNAARMTTQPKMCMQLLRGSLILMACCGMQSGTRRQ